MLGSIASFLHTFFPFFLSLALLLLLAVGVFDTVQLFHIRHTLAVQQATLFALETQAQLTQFHTLRLNTTLGAHIASQAVEHD